MAQAGGSATIYGILYQTLGTCHWASTISLTSELENNDFLEAQLIIEPQGGGGDIVVVSDECRIVEQWKAKNDRGTWSVMSLITEVFPDLYRAVELEENARPVEYRFISEGRPGRWKALYGLMETIRTKPTPSDPLSQLNNSEHRKFLSDSQMTEHEFFSWMAETLRKHEDIAKDDLNLTWMKLWHLIANFQFVSEQTIEKVQAELDYILLGAVDFREQVPGKRRELSGLVLELAGQGEVNISSRELLNCAQIKAESFANWTKLYKRLGEEITHHVQGEWYYHQDHDVRIEPEWPYNYPVLVLSGESGQGKTWQLGALAMNVVATEGLAATVTASGDADRDLQSAANMIWQNALGHDQQLSLERLIQRRREIAPKLEGWWLTVLIDDVLSIEEARRIVSRDWNSFGVRVAITTLPPIARSLQTQFRDIVHVVDVKDFSLQEAQEFLRRCGHDWGRLPSDVREILKRPLLARLFAELTVSEEWLPNHEYELFEKFWFRIRDARNQAVHPGDLSWMKKLAATVLDETLPYPWPQSSLVQLGLPDEVQLRLESVGWLRRLDGEKVEVWHDRILNWAVAEELVERRSNGSVTARELNELIATLWGDSSRRSGRYLGYVPLDVLWIIGSPMNGLHTELHLLIEALENAMGLSPLEFDRLYIEHLPNLGERVIPGILERVRGNLKGDESRFPQLAANAIKKIGQINTEAVAKCGQELVAEHDVNLQYIGLQVLATAPAPSTLDRIWELHIGHCAEKQSKKVRSWWTKYEASFSALCNGVRQCPEWLEIQIDTSDPEQEPIHELAYVLASLEGEAGSILWKKKKELLFIKVPSNKLRCLARCIEHFRDDSEIERLKTWLNISDDLLAPTALMALSRIDPQLALQGLKLIDPTELYMCRHWWIGQLAARCPGETQTSIRELMLLNPTNKWNVAEIYQGSLHLMDEETLRLLLDDLIHLARSRLENPKDADNNLYRPLTLLENITSPHLLPTFESYTGSELENLLVELASFRFDRASLYVDHELEGIRSVLLKINGEGLTTFVNAELSSKNKHIRLDGVWRSLMRPNRATRELLRAQIDHDELWDEKGFPLVQLKASIMLAVLGENEAVVRSILRWNNVLQKLADVRSGMAPMSDSDLTEVIVAIESNEDDQCIRGISALSVSGRSDLAPLAIEVLQRADPTSPLARSAVWALGDLECRTAEAIALFEKQLKIPDHKYAAIIALARIGTPEAYACLVRCLMESGISSGDFEDSILAMNLSYHSASRATVATAVWNAIQADPDWNGQPELFETLVLLKSPTVKDWLLHHAYEPDSAIHTAGRRVWIIRTLGKMDREAAFRACESALLSEYRDNIELARLLFELNGDLAIPTVCRIATKGVKSVVRYSLGLALRLVKQKEIAGLALGELLQSKNAIERKIALELAGWAGPGSLTHSEVEAMLDDNSISVRMSACKTLSLYQVEADVIELLRLLKKSSGSRTWSLLDAVLRSANPHALQCKLDPLFLGDAYPNNDVPYWLYCEKRLERRMKDIDKEVTDIDRNID